MSTDKHPTLYVDAGALANARPSDRLHAYAAPGVVAREVEYVPASVAAALRAENDRLHAFIASLHREVPDTGARACDGVAHVDKDWGEIACMRLSGHAGEHVALAGDAMAADLAEALVEGLTDSRANIALRDHGQAVHIVREAVRRALDEGSSK